MFKKSLFAMSLSIMTVLAAAGCSAANAGENKVYLGQEFILPVGHSATVSGQDLVIKFDSVTTDSRSPNGAQTIWAGEAKIKLQITYRGSTSVVDLTEKGSTGGYTQDSFLQFNINFELQPYPEVGKQPDAGEYTLLLKITGPETP